MLARTVVVGVLALLIAASSAASTAPSDLIPPCPKVTISPDGNASPLFCTIANPAALAFYRPLARHLFELTHSTSDGELRAAIGLDLSRLHVTPPEECQALKLWRYITRFPVTPGSQFVMPGLC